MLDFDGGILVIQDFQESFTLRDLLISSAELCSDATSPTLVISLESKAFLTPLISIMSRFYAMVLHWVIKSNNDLESLKI